MRLAKKKAEGTGLIFTVLIGNALSIDLVKIKYQMLGSLEAN
jgi:hypothetical protein